MAIALSEISSRSTLSLAARAHAQSKGPLRRVILVLTLCASGYFATMVMAASTIETQIVLHQ
jgi:hypothetical protein